ncbi:condensin complex subunit 2, partial [Geosmithia morbida]
MPRVAQVPRASNAKPPVGSSGSPFKSSSTKCAYPPVVRLQRGKRMNSRKALQEKQINEIKAAASSTPRKSSVRLDDLENASPGGPGTPRASRLAGDDGEDTGTVGTPMKRVPILANFEEWMKMATDNKINATNSWNFALIDYFHDMSLLKEGDSVNFQKASCTLDGCVKIYTNRIDSVATETGKLLSGLADSNSSKKKDRGGDEEGEDSDEELDEDGNVKKKTKKKSHRSEATLAPSFNSLQLKKFELEFSVDPLFKKASADFDEGGAKGLLLNHLMIDSQGRIVFDSSDDAADEASMGKKQDSDAQEDLDEGEEDKRGEGESMDVSKMDLGQEMDVPELDDDLDEADAEIDLAMIRQRFFPELSRLDELDVCPSLKNFDLGNPSGSTDIPFLNAPDDWRDQDKEKTAGAHGDDSGMLIDGEAALGFDDDDLGLGSFDMGGDVAFGEGGDAWARDAALEPQMRVYNAGFGQEGEGEGDGYEENGDYVVSMMDPRKADKMHEDMLSFFDQALQKNWSSAEHWRIRKIKDSEKPTTETKKRKEKEPFEIDFAAPLEYSIHDLIHTQASSNSAITMPKKDWKTKSRNLLPDDKHFNSKSLLSLFLKPKARIGKRRTGGFGEHKGFGNANTDDAPVGDMDEAFWAKQGVPQESDTMALGGGDYDANFFQDDAMPFPGGDDADDDDLEFADAREHFSPEGGMVDDGMGLTAILNGEVTNATNGAYGTTLITATRRVRPEYVQYARVAKKVDVRRLKDELWKGMEMDIMEVRDLTQEKSRRSSVAPPTETIQDVGHNELKFTEIMNNLQTVYPKTVMDDISTSFCFISLLHLANEKGLLIEKTPDLRELSIRRDLSAEIIEGA